CRLYQCRWAEAGPQGAIVLEKGQGSRLTMRRDKAVEHAPSRGESGASQPAIASECWRLTQPVAPG
ncbi:hypothetical protein HAX54_033374, partial [Datura stramonium]|nr:hypothetical protein [Datura stramonium]